MKRFLITGIIVTTMSAVCFYGINFLLTNLKSNEIVIDESSKVQEFTSQCQNKLIILKLMETCFTDWSRDDPEKWTSSAELAREGRKEMELAIKLIQENDLEKAQYHCKVADDCVEKMKKIRDSQK